MSAAYLFIDNELIRIRSFFIFYFLSFIWFSGKKNAFCVRRDKCTYEDIVGLMTWYL